jgi:anti-sigma regulatory factor (Ser/Thr protein kinase)
MPKTLCFNDHPEETLAALSEIRTSLWQPMRGIIGTRKPSKHRGGKPRWTGPYRDFSNLETITPAAALVIAAEYDRVHIANGFVPALVGVDRWNPAVVEALYGIGFFDIVGFHVAPPGDERNLIVLRMRGGDTIDPTAVVALQDDLRSLCPAGADTDNSGLIHLYGAMIEAIGNVVSHAYPISSDYEPSHTHRWWITGAANRQDRSMTAVVFDRGATIPVTLPRWRQYAGVLKRMLGTLGEGMRLVKPASDPMYDGRAILAAVEESVTSTDLPERGHGLAQMRHFVDQCRGGHLRIMSRYGEVIFRPNLEPTVKVYAKSVDGTLIEWSVLL